MRDALSMLAACWLLACGGGGAEVSVSAAAALAAPPPAPDYASDAAWAALPEREDAADRAPPGEVDGQRDAAVDVFFVHPTTYYARRANAAYDDPEASGFVDTLVLPHQAAAFNGVGRVFAPRYRQATIWTFTVREDFDRAARAMALAYGDVRRAFERFLARSDRPFVIAGHSQGSYHALRLLAERVDGDPALRERLVAAYLLGVPVPEDVFTRTLPHLEPCAGASETGCVLSWNTVIEGARPRRLRRRLPVFYPDATGWESTASKRLVCTNPLGIEAGWAPRERHLGGVRYVDPNGAPMDPMVEPALTRARCEDGLLEVERSVPFGYRSDPLARDDGDLHLADYPLFFLDIRADVARRVVRARSLSE